MPKIFEQFGLNIVKKEDPNKDGSLKTSDEIRPFLSELDRRKYREHVGHEMAPKDFNVWIVDTEHARSRNIPAFDADALRNELNPERSSSEEDRFIGVSSIPQHELHYSLKEAFPKRGEVRANLVPDLVIVRGGEGYIDAEPESELSRQYVDWETSVIRDIRQAADSALHFQEGIETGDPIRDGWTHQFLDMNILGETAATIMYEKHSITPDLAMEYVATHLFKSEADWEMAVKAFDAYARTGDETVLRRAVTPGRVRRALALSAAISEKRSLDDYHWRKDRYGKDGGFETDKDYLQYRQSLAETAQALAGEEMAGEQLFAAFKRLVDKKKSEYRDDVERRAAEARLLQPLIVSVAKSQRYQEKALAAGADIVLAELSPTDAEKLIALAHRIRTSPASIAAERLRRNKAEFYREVVDQIEDRSEQTADTAKELYILTSLFAVTDAKKVLDVGCGYGRLALPLAKRGYDVTGIEASRVFLEKAKTGKGACRNLRYKEGDIIDYREIAGKDEFDAVYYGWHSFLEAYGAGNSLASLRSARHALKPGGTIMFDQPSRENPGLTDGWYGDAEHGYLAYLMDEDEVRFMLTAAGFEDVHILHWSTKPSEAYPDGMKKWTVVARKPEIKETEDKWWLEKEEAENNGY